MGYWRRHFNESTYQSYGNNSSQVYIKDGEIDHTYNSLNVLQEILKSKSWWSSRIFPQTEQWWFASLLSSYKEKFMEWVLRSLLFPTKETHLDSGLG